MKNVLVMLSALLFSSIAFADVGVSEAPPVKPAGVQCHNVVICKLPVHKKKKKVLPPAKVVVLKPTPGTPKVVVVHQKEYVRVPVLVKVKEVEKCKEKVCKSESRTVIVGGHIGLGAGALPGYASGNLGLRLEIPKALMGFEVFLSAPYGVGADAMLYVYRGSLVKVHILDAGFLLNFQNCGGPTSVCKYNLSNQQFARRIDLIFGAGIQVKLHCNLDLTADWRVDVPDPVGLYNHRNDTVSVPYLNDSNVFKNSFGSSQLILGLTFHN